MELCGSQDQQAAGWVPDTIRRGLALLLQAQQYAEDLGRDVWDFAVEAQSLRAAGLTSNDLRWLVCKGYVAHAREVPALGARGRVFRRGPELTFDKHTCFVLTPAGREAAEHRCVEPARAAWPPNGTSRACDGNGVPGGPWEAALPRWDSGRRQFRIGNLVVKEYKLPSPNQEMILAAFEEEGWPPRIDDPLPPARELDPKRRLHDTIKSLNRNQRRRIIRFMGDGTGEGIRWELVQNGKSDNSPEIACKTA